MALIKCPKCGKEISDVAGRCPNCRSLILPGSINSVPSQNIQQIYDQPIAAKKPRQSKLGILALILCILGCTFWLGIILAIIDLCKKDGNKKVCSVIAICVSVFWFGLVVGVGGLQDNSTQNTSGTATTSTVSTQDTSESGQQTEERETQEINEDSQANETQAVQMNKEEFIESCTEIPYKTLARNPEDYIGDHIVLTIKVSQIIQGGFFDNSEYYRVYTNDEYNMWLGDEYFMYDSRADDNTKILQDDMLTVYAEFAGTQMVERAWTGTKEEVLAIKALYIDFISEEDLEDNSYNVSNDIRGVTGIEAQKHEDEAQGELEDFRYEISGDKVLLESYSGSNSVLEIKTSYMLDGVEYKTDLSDFQVGIGNSKVKTLILDYGFTEVKDSIFNSCDVENVYFPKSMINVYDYTLSYLHPDDGETIKIYYGGTQEEWLNIFTEYQRTKVDDAEWGTEKGKALADKINEMVGSEYDSLLFEYFFSANPDDLK